MSLNVGVIADFNADNLVRLLAKQLAGLEATVTAAPFGQVMQTLLMPDAPFWGRPYDLIVVWTSPAAAVPRFDDVVEFRSWSADDLDRDVEGFAALLQRLASRVPNVFVSSWAAAPGSAHRPALEMKAGVGASAALLRMNLRLTEALRGEAGVVVFNTERWLRQGGPGAFNDKLLYLSKTPFSKAVFTAAAEDMSATLRSMKGQRKKVVIVDLDNTLWGGVVGDVGWEGVQLGGHDPVGEAYVQFQRELKRLSNEGILLAIVSKNEETVALDAIDSHPEMMLRSTAFSGWRINWDDKAQNIAELMADLNLGLDSAVFLDDSPHERERVRQALPSVVVPEWPTDPMEYAAALRGMRFFDTPSISTEDLARTAMYVSDRERKALRVELGSMDEWLATLDLEVQVEALSTANLERTSQLLNKTNQMNLTTRRLSPQELASWAAEENHRLWAFRVRDKLGDYGLCGIASVSLQGARADLVDFILSCRAMGRGVEDAIISVVASAASSEGASCLVASPVPTAKNKPCVRWLEEHEWFTVDDDRHTFRLASDRVPSPPKHIRVTAPA